MKNLPISALAISTILIAFLIINCCQVVSSAKILFLLPIATHSQKAVFEPLIKALALRDHDITVVSPVPSRGLPVSVKEIHPVTVEELGFGLKGIGKDLLETRRTLQSTNHYFPVLWNLTLVDHGCHRLYNDVEIKYLLKGFKRFDLAVVSGILNECALGLVHHFKVPHIYLTTSPAPNYVVSRFGHWFPTSFVPSPYTNFDETMGFLERSVNFLVETVLLGFAKFYLYPHYEDLYRGYVGEETPGIEEIDDGVGVVLMNSHLVTSYPRPVMPNLIEVGGMHCRTPHPLPTGLDKFLSEAEDGFIYFDLGPLVQADDIPDVVLKVFLNVFSNLDQRVIWKLDKDIAKKPENVMISQYLPQQDILGHRNIKLFISNGDSLSAQLAVFHGVQMLSIPLTGEQDLSSRQAELDGFALSWEILSLNGTSLEEVIDTLIIQPQYKARAKQLSKVYRDLPEVALEKAIFYTEYVLRNKGAPHLRSSSKDLNFFQYHSLDVIAFLSLILSFMFYLIYLMISKILRSCCFSPRTRASPMITTDSRNGQANNSFKNKYD